MTLVLVLACFGALLAAGICWAASPLLDPVVDSAAPTASGPAQPRDVAGPWPAADGVGLTIYS